MAEDMSVFERRAKGMMPVVSDPEEEPRFGKEQTKFLEAMRRYYNVDIARRACGMTPQALNAMIAEDREFFAEVEQAARGPAALLIEKLMDVALHGEEVELTYKGAATGQRIRKHNSAYMIIALKLMMPEKFVGDDKVVALSPGDGTALPDEEELIRLTDSLL